MILCNEKAEMAVVGCCLAGGRETSLAALGQVEDSDFSDLPCLDAWRVVRALAEGGGPVDDTAFDAGWRKQVKGATVPPVGIFEAEGNTWASRLEEHVTELKSWSRRRKVHAAALKLSAAALNHKADLEDELAKLQDGLRLPPVLGDRELSGERSVETLVADLEERQARAGALSGISTGFGHLDALTDGFQATDLSIIGARPSQGKSALLLGFASHAALKLGRPVLFLSLEMSIKSLLRRLASMESGVPLSVLKRGQMSERDFPRVTAFNLRLKTAPLWFVSGLRGFNAPKVGAIVRRYAQDHGIALVLVDYLQKIKACERQEKRTYEVAEVSGSLKGLAEELNLHVCAAAQLSREPDKATGKEKGRMPRISDLADCAQIERDADLVCLLHRPALGDEASLIVAKQRDDEVGIQHLWFEGARCRFYEQSNEKPN